MGKMELFSKNEIVGVFRGFSEGGLEFHADLALPYKSEFQSIPMHGQFLLVQLETENEAVLGRITSLSSAGKLASGIGEEFNIRALQEDRPVPEDLREKYLKYQIDIRVLGVVRINQKGKLLFIPSHRRLPHVGSPVAFLNNEVLREVVGHNSPGSPIGHYALGEFVYCEKPEQAMECMQIKSPEVEIKFPVENLVSRRSFIFARAGFGKSNLNKLLFSVLYKDTPVVEKRKGRKVPVGTLLFDPDGEYFWPDDKGRPGLCDVPHLEDRLVVFTNRKGPSDFYDSFVASGIKIDIRNLRPVDVISLSISSEKQDQQNIAKLKSLKQSDWIRLVDLIDAEKGDIDTEIKEISAILKLSDGQNVEAMAARSNMRKIVGSLHSKESRFIDMLFQALKEGKLCVIDISQMRGQQGLILSSLILRKIFDHNQDQFTEAVPETIPVLAVVEEAQSVLNSKSVATESYIEWVKEGRKYDLGAVLITQQPGSIPNEILSQGDNWFVFHLLSAGDLKSIKHANSHFSDDILGGLLNEPIPGQGVFWSSSNGKPYPTGIRVLSFESRYKVRDPSYNNPPGETFAKVLKDKNPLVDPLTGESDHLCALRLNAAAMFREDKVLMNDFKDHEKGVAWGRLKALILKLLPKSGSEKERGQKAYDTVKPVLNELFGERGWETFSRPGKDSKSTVYVRSKIA